MNLDQLKRSRASRHGLIKPLIATIEQAVIDEDVVAVEDNMSMLLEKEAALSLIHQQIEEATDPDALPDEIVKNEDFADIIIRMKIKANRFMTQHAQQTPAVVSAVKSSKPSIKLPKLQIVKFNGEIADWQRFWDQFDAGIHKNVHLTAIDKYNYLKGLLTETAGATIKGLQLTEANYLIAIDLLKEKYGKVEMLIAEHVKQLWNIKRVAKVENGQDLRRFLEEFKAHLFSLKALGKDISSMGTLLGPVILQALPLQLVREWNRQTQGKDNEDLPKLLEFVRIELEAIEQAWRSAAARVDSSKPVVRKETDLKVAKDAFRATTSSLLVTKGNEDSKSKGFQSPYCIFCDEGTHRSGACTATATFEDRMNALRRRKRCVRCTRKNHYGKPCDQVLVCRECQKNHHTLLCFKRCEPAGVGKRQETQPKAKMEGAQTLVASMITPTGKRTKSILQTIRIWVKTPKGLEPVIALIDGGSERSFVSRRVSQQLQVSEGIEEELTVHAFGGTQKKQRSRHIPLTLVGANGVQLDISALEVETICNEVRFWEAGRIETFLRNKRVYSWNESMGQGEAVAIDLLIGSDWYWRIMTGHMKRLSSFLMATESVFGWMLQGSIATYSPNPKIVTMLSVLEPLQENKLEKQIAALWELDKEGILAKEELSTRSVQDVEVLEHFEKTTTYENGRYQVEIPWTEQKPCLGNNFFLAKERLRKLLFRLQKTPEQLERYKKGIYEYLENQHSEEVAVEDEEEPLYYLPHHPIIKEDRKTTKLRIVFDGSSHEEPYLSLNQCQAVGPNLNPKIFELLMRFRWHQIGFSSDVTKAFLQIQLKESERNATRFLWTDHKWEDGKETPIKVFRMTRVLFGMRSSPFLLAATIRLHLQKHPESNPMVQQLIDNNMYVDDLLSGACNTQEALFISQEARRVMSHAGMQLTKWATNDSDLREKWIEKGLVSPEEPVELLKILGLMWNPSNDRLTFKTTAIFEASRTVPNTKRGILELMARIYDPLGFLAPKLVVVKCLLQDLWRLKIDWDEEIPADLKDVWLQWKEDIQLLDQVSVPRCCTVLKENDEHLQLHVFCDASPKAYGTVVYLKSGCMDASAKISLLAAKTRVSPLQLISVPRLELLACVLSVRLATTILTAWGKTSVETYFWTDSKVALQWIGQPPGKWKLFVGRRVQEIQSCQLNHQWSYCQTRENVADCLTRGQNLKQLTQNHNWWQGPKWLQQNCQEWDGSEFSEDDDLQQQINEEKVKTVVVQIVQEQPKLFDTTQFSSWNRIIRITSWIFRFVNRCRKKSPEMPNCLTFKEMQYSERYWLKFLQAEQFSKEKESLKKEEQIPSTSCILPFNPFLDDQGLIRLGGRIRFSRIPTEQKHPILLKGENDLVTLFILDRHKATLHGGVQSTLMKIRQEIWLIKGRQTVRKALGRCMSCRKWNAQPAQMIEAPLPAARINESNPFEISGLDFAGPVWIKEEAHVRKSYICLFTCAVTRAVHLELALYQNQKSFLLAFRRFVARRGCCKVVYSDNAKTLKQTDKLLQDSYKDLQSSEVQNQATKSGIQWRFIAPRSSWWGGFYERLVGSVKFHLKRQLGSALLDAEELVTTLTEIEAVINCRPLGKITEDPEDPEHLTPSHFLMGKADGALTDIVPGLTSIPSQANMRKRWKYRKQLMERFWKQWRNEYLLQLKTFHEQKNVNRQIPVLLGDVVLVKEEKIPRGKWKLARIMEVTPGRDGQVRSVMLKTTSGQIFRRAIQNICPLELL